MKKNVGWKSLMLALTVLLAGNLAALADAPELDRTLFTADASSYSSWGPPSDALAEANTWQAIAESTPNGSWLRIDFGIRCELVKISHRPHVSYWGINAYEIEALMPAIPLQRIT